MQSEILTVYHAITFDTQHEQQILHERAGTSQLANASLRVALLYKLNHQDYNDNVDGDQAPLVKFFDI